MIFSEHRIQLFPRSNQAMDPGTAGAMLGIRTRCTDNYKLYKDVPGSMTMLGAVP